MRKAKLAFVQDIAGNLPRGLRRPTRVVSNDRCGEAAVIDADAKTLFVTSLGVAHLASTAINTYPKLCADIAARDVCLKELRRRLRLLPRTPAVAELLAIVDVAFAEINDEPVAELPV